VSVIKALDAALDNATRPIFLGEMKETEIVAADPPETLEAVPSEGPPEDMQLVVSDIETSSGPEVEASLKDLIRRVLHGKHYINLRGALRYAGMEGYRNVSLTWFHHHFNISGNKILSEKEDPKLQRLRQQYMYIIYTYIMYTAFVMMAGILADAKCSGTNVCMVCLLAPPLLTSAPWVHQRVA